ncbi:hypothetical protein METBISCDRAFT_25738 [Metschnikowia bicuspidata]|uniref:Uncharacterized protein n=1 Tax=Metschnikowia bicuspidata TaxID=27322 RepID=A0A4P9ZH90_9ASCO|nr:hypothetical protein METBISCDRAFT_25738 [Metschnikowia bicuspidata]
MPSDALPSPQITSALPRTRSLASQLLDVRLLKLDKATDSPNSASSNPVAGEATVIIADYPHCISSLRQRPITTAHSQHTDNRSTNDSAHVSHLRPLNVSHCTQPSLMGDQGFEMDRRVRGGAKGTEGTTSTLGPRNIVSPYRTVSDRGGRGSVIPCDFSPYSLHVTIPDPVSRTNPDI